MKYLTYLKDTPFLKALAKQKTTTTYTKIIILDKNELPIQSIEGKISAGNISINGSSAVRRTGSLTFIAQEADNIQLTNVNSLLSMNRRIQIFIGVGNEIDKQYDNIIWFPLGIYVITQPNISHSLQGTTIQLSFKDKMCLLNGECGGGLPASVVLDSYNQVIGCEYVSSLADVERNDYTVYILQDDDTDETYWMWDGQTGWVEGDSTWVDPELGLVGTTASRKQRVFDVIQTLVANYGGEDLAKILISDVPLEIKQIVRYTGASNLYYNTSTHYYSLNEKDTNIADVDDPDTIKVFSFNDDIGYTYTDFTYPGELVSGIGDNVANMLEKIKTTLGNYEYFYDIYGNFVFQEIKNYLNNSYSSTIVKDNSLLNEGNYKAEFNNAPQSVFTFEEGSDLIISYSNTPVYSNIKNDFHVWGETEDAKVIHYHLAIKEPPTLENEYYVVYEIKNGEYTGKIRLALEEDFALQQTVSNGTWTPGEDEISVYDIEPTGDEEYAATVEDDYHLELETLYLTDGLIHLYKPTDWRAEMYLQGLQKKALGQRPDIYEQELLDYMDSIYNFQKQEYKVDILNKPNELDYYIDFLEPSNELHDYSVDTLGPRIHSYQQTNINKLYNTDIPNIIIINNDFAQATKDYLIDRCEMEGQPYSNVSPEVYKTLAMQTSGYSAQDTMRELLYQYTNYNEKISITTVPLYFLEVNTRISIYDKAANIYGDYIINSISSPLGAGTMSISATRAQERI